jgi:replication-associated recombination protein RarA
MTWHEALGLSANPLDIRPNTTLVGLEQQEKKLKNHIRKGELCFLNGLTGSGKTSLLMKAKEDLDDYKFVYLDAQSLPDDFNLEAELKKKKGFFDTLFLRDYPKKKPVLLIDEFQDTSEDVVMDARAKWESADERRIKSIVIAQIDQHLNNVTDSFKERIGKRVIRLPTLTDKEMREVLKKRLQTSQVNLYKKLHEEAINLLIAVADGNVRRLLEYTDAIFDFHHTKFGDYDPIKKSPTYLVTYYAAKEILENHDVNVDAYTYLEPEDKIRGTDEFEEEFTSDEQDILFYILGRSCTADELADEFDVSKSTIYSRLSDLRDKDAIEEAGRDGRKKRWKATEHVKRLTVKV